MVSKLTRRLINRDVRRARETSADSERSAQLIFETFEPRLLLAADPLGITAGYAFNEVSGTTAADASGHGIVGMLTNGPTFTAGKYGNAVTLDGTNDFVNLGNPTALQFTGSMTISAWVYVTSFPSDDAAVVSKRTSGESGYQLDITKDTGPRTIGFKLTNSSDAAMFRYGATTLQLNTWYHIAGVYNAANQTLDVYLNGALDDGQLVGTVTSSQQNSNANVDVGRRAGITGFEFAGRVDDVRIADHALTQTQIQTDMATPLGGTTPPPPDTTLPNVSLTPPAPILAGTVTLAATASDNVGVAGVKFLLDANTTIGSEDTTSPYGISWNTTTASNGTHTLTAQARDAANNIATSTAITVTVDNEAPTGTIVINGGAAATNSTTATLALTATDAVTSVTQMRFSNNGTSFSTAEVFAPTKTWTLSSGAGTKTVYVQFRDAAGNWSTAVNDNIVLDTTAPTISARTATNITGSSATITWTTNEPATSQVEYGLTTGYGSMTTIDSALVTAHSVTITGIAPSTTYNWRVRSKDVAGNEAISANSTFNTAATSDTTPPTATWSGPAANSVLAGTVTLSATASDNVAVGGVQFLMDGNPLSSEDTTSPYSILWNTTTAASGTHTLQARARDTSGNTATTSAISITVDNVTPTGTVVINSNATATKNATVTLALSASDTQGPVTEMRFSNNNTTYSAAEAYATTKTWTLASGDGTKTVYAQFQDAAGNWSAAATDTIVLDTTPPSISAVTATVVTSSSVRVTWATNEASTSQVDYGPTTTYGTTTLLDAALVTSHSVTLTGLTANATYNFHIRSSDSLGTEGTSANATFIIDTAAPSIPTALTATAISSSQINLSWTASTDNVAVTGYQVFRAGSLIATVASTSYSNSGLVAGTNYVYTVKAIDAAGNASLESGSANATTLTPDTTSPTVTITGPAPNATVSGTVLATANASDNVGVVGVQFLVDANPFGPEDTTSPYSVSWDTTAIANGTHALSARARDAAGNTTMSTPINVTVSNLQNPGLVAAYDFDEGTGTTAHDLSGNNNIASLQNGVAWAAGQYGSAAKLDGVNDFILIPNSATTNVAGNEITISMWINPQPTGTADTVLIGKFWNATMTAPYYQYGLELTGGTVPNFEVGTAAGVQQNSMQAGLPLNQWSYLAVVYDGAQVKYYVNGALVTAQPLSATIVARGNPINVGADISPNQFTKGLLDDLRIYNRALTQTQVQSDMMTPIGQLKSGDTNPPTVLIDSLTTGASVHDIVTVTADAADDVGIAGVQFFVDGVATGMEDTLPNPYGFNWDTRTVSNGAHTVIAQAIDVNGNTTLSTPVTVNVANSSGFQNQILATGFNLPTTMAFLPDGRMLVGELGGTVWILSPPYVQPDPTPFLQIANVGTAGVEQGLYNIAIDPNFVSNHYFYVAYTLGTPNHDRLSRFTANATLTGTVPGSEVVFYEDTLPSGSDHHGGAIAFGNDGKLYFTTGDDIAPASSQDLNSPRGKVLRFNMDGTVPTDNPFYDGSGPHFDAIWALGLRNPYNAYFDPPTGRLIVGDVGGNDWTTAIEEVDIITRGANYGWPNVEAPNGNLAYTAPAYYYTHIVNGTPRDSAITGGFVYHGTQFPSGYEGSYFFADYTQNWIKRLTFDANGNVNGVFNFEPLDGLLDGPYGDIVKLIEGPDGALYYVDIGFSDQNVGPSTYGISKIRRIEYLQGNLAPVVAASATPTAGPTPLTVTFSSDGSADPEGQPLTYLWDFGNGTTSAQANPTYTYTKAGLYHPRLSVSDGVNTTFSAPLSISAGNAPIPIILSPTVNDPQFVAGQVITFSGTATDIEDGVLPASAYTWTIDFLHADHVHPGLPITGVTSGTFTIPTSGHDFEGDTRYRVRLTVTDSDGLQASQEVIIYPQKINISFNAPAGVTLYLDGIAHTAPFVYDDIVNFTHVINAPNQTIGTTTYNFASWSDGGAQQHTITSSDSSLSFTANYTVTAAIAPPAFVQANAATPQTSQTQVSVAYTAAQVAGNTNIVVIGWDNTTSNILSVTDSAGNVYQLAAPTTRGSGLSQAIYYASNIKAAGTGANTVTVTFNTATPYVDLRAVEYSGLNSLNPIDAAASTTGTGATASTASVTTTNAQDLIFAAGTTKGSFSAAGANFTNRIITTPDGDIVEDRLVAATGSYNATAALSGSAAWVMQTVTFKAAS